MPLGSSSAAPVTTPGPRRRAIAPSEFIGTFARLSAESIDDGIAALLADQPGRDLHARGRLAALVLRSFKQTPHSVDGCDIEPFPRQLFGGKVALDQAFQDRIEHGIRRQRILVLLV